MTASRPLPVTSWVMSGRGFELASNYLWLDWLRLVDQTKAEGFSSETNGMIGGFIALNTSSKGSVRENVDELVE